LVKSKKAGAWRQIGWETTTQSVLNLFKPDEEWIKKNGMALAKKDGGAGGISSSPPPP